MPEKPKNGGWNGRRIFTEEMGFEPGMEERWMAKVVMKKMMNCVIR